MEIRVKTYTKRYFLLAGVTARHGALVNVNSAGHLELQYGDRIRATLENKTAGELSSWSWRLEIDRTGCIQVWNVLGLGM